MPVMSLVVDEFACVAQHRRRRQPALILRRQPVQRLELAKKLHRVRPYRLRMARIDTVAPRRRQHALPPFVLKLLVDRGPRVLLCQHLRQDSVTQSQRRVAKPRHPKALQQFRKYLSPGHNNLRPPRPDSRHSLAVWQG